MPRSSALVRPFARVNARPRACVLALALAIAVAVAGCGSTKLLTRPDQTRTDQTTVTLHL